MGGWRKKERHLEVERQSVCYVSGHVVEMYCLHGVEAMQFLRTHVHAAMMSCTYKALELDDSAYTDDRQ